MTADPTVSTRSGTRRRLGILAGCAAGTVILDAVSKHVVVAELSDRGPVTLIPHVLDLELTRNAGAAFSLGTGSTVVFTVVAVGVVGVIIRLAPRLVSGAWAAVLGLLLGGALGNLGDRIFRAPGVGRGAVVDWIHLHHWPIFNIADSAITIGGVLAVLLSMRGVSATRAGAP